MAVDVVGLASPGVTFASAKAHLREAPGREPPVAAATVPSLWTASTAGLGREST